MVRSFFRQIALPRIVAGVALYRGEGTDMTGEFVLVRLEAGKIRIESPAPGPMPWEELWEKIPPEIPVCLALDGSGVLVKRCPEFTGDIPAFLAQVFPGQDMSAFAWQLVAMPGASVLTLARQDILNVLIGRIEQQNRRVLHLDLGFSGVERLRTFFPAFPNPLVSRHWLLYHADQQLANFEMRARDQRPDVFCPIGDTEINGNCALAFAATLPAFAGAGADPQNLPAVPVSRLNFQVAQYVKTGGLAFLALLLVALVLNTLVFFQLRSKVEQQSVLLATNKNQLARLDTLQQQFQQKQQFLKQHGLINPSRTAWYADQIGASVPPGIQLTELAISPVESSTGSRRETQPHFLTGLIRIKGISQHSTELNQWIKTLQAINWVQKVTVLPYSENQAGQGEFELELRLAD